MDELPQAAIGSVLKEMEKDRWLRELAMEGFLTYKNVESVVGPLARLFIQCDRTWERVVIRVSFDGDVFDDVPEWEVKVRVAKVRLEEVCAYPNIPIDFHA